MSYTSKNNFISYTTRQSDFQRKNLFRALMFHDNQEEAIQFYVVSTHTPDDSTSILRYSWMNSHFNIAGKTSHNNWTVTVREASGGGNIASGSVYQFFNSWRNIVYNRDGYWVGNNGNGEPLNPGGIGVSGHPKEYKGVIALDLLKGPDEISKSFILEGAWPASISQSQLDQSSADLMEFTVTFAYDRFISVG